MKFSKLQQELKKDFQHINIILLRALRRNISRSWVKIKHMRFLRKPREIFQVKPGESSLLLLCSLTGALTFLQSLVIFLWFSFFSSENARESTSKSEVIALRSKLIVCCYWRWVIPENIDQWKKPMKTLRIGSILTD